MRRWLPGRALVIIGITGFAAISWLFALAQHPDLRLIVRFRLDARLFAPTPKRKRGQLGRPRLKGQRLPTLGPLANRRTTAWKRMVVKNG